MHANKKYWQISINFGGRKETVLLDNLAYYVAFGILYYSKPVSLSGRDLGMINNIIIYLLL